MSVKIGAELVHIVGEMVALRFELPTLTEGTEVESDSLYAIFAVDKSGSMSGGPMNDAKGAAESLTAKFKASDIPVSVYPFDSRFKEYHAETDGYDVMIEKIKALNASGGTIFANVLHAIKKRIEEKQLKNVFCVWLTDGQDNNGLNTLIPIFDEHKVYFENNGVSIAIHCIGFSSGHDANLLTKLSQSGTRPGTFQYVPEGGRIPVAVNNIYTLAFESSVWARLTGAGDSSYKVIIETENNTYKALVYISENDLEDTKVEIHRGNQVNVVEIEPSRGEHRSIEDIVHLVTAFISSKIATALEKGIETAKAKLQELAGVIEEAERRLNSLFQDCSTLRPYKRKQLVPFFTATNELIVEYKKIALSPNNIENVQFANLNSLANKVFLKKNLEKKIAKESGDNFKVLFESDEKVERLIPEFDKSALEAKHAEYLSLRNLKCALSSEGWVDLLLHGDCLCITLYVERPQNLLGNPYDIKIKSVNYLTVSHDNFLNSKLFETKAGQIIQGERSYAHGSIPPKASDLISGLTSEQVNGVLPIFINEDHWKIASLRMSQMLGYNINVDVLGFNEEQLLVFPFMAYAKALEQNSELLVELLRGTCDQVYKEKKEKILPQVLDALEKYTSDPVYRLEIKDNSVLLGWISSAFRSGDIQDFQNLFVHILEEEIRRNFAYGSVGRVNEVALKLLKIDVAPELERVRNSLMKGGVSYAEHFRAALSTRTHKEAEEVKTEVPAEVKGEEEKKVEEFTYEFTGTHSELPEEAASNFDKINSGLMPDGFLYKFVQLFKELGFNLKTLEDFGLTSAEQKLLFLVQALGYKKDRKETLETGLFAKTYSAEEASYLVKKFHTLTVMKEVLGFRSKVMAELSSNEGSKKAAIFAMTSDLEEAAGCLYGISQGGATWPLFAKALQDRSVPEIIAKVKMMTLGHHQGVKLVLDNINNSATGFVVWNPKKKRVFKIWSNNKDSAPKELWQEAFPQKFDYIEHIYLRNSGVFVPYSNPRKNVVDPRHWEGKSKDKKPAPGTGGRGKRGRGGRGGARGGARRAARGGRARGGRRP